MLTSTKSFQAKGKIEIVNNNAIEDKTSPGSILSIPIKKSICKKLKEKINDPNLPDFLELAARKNISMPFILQQSVNSLFEARKTQENHPEVLIHLDKAISAFFQYNAVPMFLQVLNEKYNDRDWSSTFLVFLSDYLKLKKTEESYVKGKILEGKVYWEYIREGKLVHRNYDESDLSLEGLAEFKMSYEQFIIFKNSGKRHGNVRITRERFIECFVESKKTPAGKIWDELNQKEIIHDNGKLSPAFHLLSNQIIALSNICGKIRYPEVMSAIQSCLDNENYCREFSEVPDETLPYRLHRNIKNWCNPARATLGGRVQNNKISDKNACSQLWDVSTHSELSARRNTKYEISRSHLKLNYDHIPSADVIKDASQLAESSQQSESWWTIAIPEKMHKQGESYMQSRKDQQGLGFLTNIVCYIEFLKTRPGDFGLTEVNTLIQALGAFRYLYKRGLDSKTKIYLDKTEKFKIASEPSLFFHQKEDCKKIDNLFVCELNQLKK